MYKPVFEPNILEPTRSVAAQTAVQTSDLSEVNLNYQDKVNPSLSFSTYENVTLLLHQRRYAAALLELAKVAHLAQTDPQFWHLQGEALANLGRYPDALKSFDQSLLWASNPVPTLVFQAVCWIHLSAYEQALDCCDRALALQPNDPQAWLFQGVALQRLGKYRDAYRSYDHALSHHQPSILERLTNRLRNLFGAANR